LEKVMKNCQGALHAKRSAERFAVCGLVNDHRIVTSAG
jgi:hypothetical protein